MYLRVLLYSTLTFARHRDPADERQVKTVRRSLTKDAAKTVVHIFVTSRVDYCNSVLQHVSAVHFQSTACAQRRDTNHIA